MVPAGAQISSAAAWRRTLLLCLALLLGGARADAAVFTVTSNGDGADAAPGNGTCADAGGACTLRAAVMEANALAGADSISVGVTSAITLASALPALAQSVTINGPGAAALSIDAAQHGRVFTVNAGVILNLADLTLTGGTGGLSNAGGAIENSGTANLTRMRLVANHADYGGAIANLPGGKLTLSDSTLDGNVAVAGFGGAIYNVGGGTVVTIIGCTISNNTAFHSAINAPVGTLVTIANSTITGNTSTGNGTVAGILGGPNVTVTNCTIVGNHGYGASSPKLRNSIIDSCAPYPTIMLSYGYNVAPSTACFVAPGTGDQFTTNLLLGPLQNNGGPTDTVALLPGSPALDAVPLASCPLSVDQRGVPRPMGAACDAGAYEEVVIPTPTPTVGCVQPPADMVAWWPLETAAPLVDDVWTFDNNGTAAGAPQAIAGWVNGGLRFDGVATLIDVPSSASLNFGAAASVPPGDFSIDAWLLRPPTAAGSGVRSLVDKRQGQGTTGYQFYLFNGQLGLQLADATFNNYNSGVVVPADGRWHHVAVTVERNSSTGIRFYADGVQVGSSFDPTLHPGSLANTSPLRIGAQVFGGELLDAGLDELQIFARALSAAEIRAIFDAQQFGKCTPTPSVTATPTVTRTASATATVTETPSPSGHAELCVTKFNDLNGNGQQDTGEPGLAGWTVEVTDLFGNVITTLTTTASGTICGGIPAPASYTVFEVPQAGWTQTFPAPPGLHAITVTAGQLLNLSFGNWRGGTTPSATATATVTPTARATATATPTVTPPPTLPCAAPPAGMVGWWALDEQPGAGLIHDLAGVPNHGTPRDYNGNAGVITATITGSAPVPVTGPPLSLPSGAVAGALYFYDPYIDVPDQAELDFGSGDFTLDAWVWPPPPTGAGTGISPIIDKLDLAGQSGYAFYLLHNGGGPYNVPTVRIGTGAFTTLSANVSLTPGMWNHVAVTVNRSLPSGVTFYVNGIAAGSGAPPAGTTDNAQPLWIGRSRLSPPVGFAEVALDEIEIFNRVLTPLEIQTLATAGAGGKCKPPICSGDCDGDARVGIDELVRGVNIALGGLLAGACGGVDLDGDGMVSIAELIGAVNHALGGCPTTVLESPGGLGLEIRAARPAIGDVAGGGADPATLTVEISAELRNDTGEALYAIAALAPERGDVGVEVGNQRKVCKHKFLWWGYDCFDYQVIGRFAEPPLPVPPDPTTLVHLALVDEPGPRDDGAPADLVLGIVGSRDLTRIAAALDVDPETLRLGAPPLLPGARVPLDAALPLQVDVPMREAAVGIVPLTLGVTIADDTGDSRTAFADCNLFFDWFPEPSGLRIGIACGYWH